LKIAYFRRRTTEGAKLLLRRVNAPILAET
jgi:hypothetical protein